MSAPDSVAAPAPPGAAAPPAPPGAAAPPAALPFYQVFVRLPNSKSIVVGKNRLVLPVDSCGLEGHVAERLLPRRS